MLTPAACLPRTEGMTFLRLDRLHQNGKGFSARRWNFITGTFHLIEHGIQGGVAVIDQIFEADAHHVGLFPPFEYARIALLDADHDESILVKPANRNFESLAK